jgi:hypothetical protein
MSSDRHGTRLATSQEVAALAVKEFGTNKPVRRVHGVVTRKTDNSSEPVSNDRETLARFGATEEQLRQIDRNPHQDHRDVLDAALSTARQTGCSLKESVQTAFVAENEQTLAAHAAPVIVRYSHRRRVLDLIQERHDEIVSRREARFRKDRALADRQVSGPMTK